jgi:hypothetical protein
MRQSVFGFDSGGHEPSSARDVIEANDPVVDSDGQVRNLKLVLSRKRLSLECPAEVVAEQAGPAADEWW